MYEDEVAATKQGMLGGLAKQLRVPSLRENLEGQLQTAQQNVARIQELLSLLDAHPEVNRIMELLGQRY